LINLIKKINAHPDPPAGAAAAGGFSRPSDTANYSKFDGTADRTQRSADYVCALRSPSAAVLLVPLRGTGHKSILTERPFFCAYNPSMPDHMSRREAYGGSLGHRETGIAVGPAVSPTPAP